MIYFEVQEKNKLRNEYVIASNPDLRHPLCSTYEEALDFAKKYKVFCALRAGDNNRMGLLHSITDIRIVKVTETKEIVTEFSENDGTLSI